MRVGRGSAKTGACYGIVGRYVLSPLTLDQVSRIFFRALSISSSPRCYCSSIWGTHIQLMSAQKDKGFAVVGVTLASMPPALYRATIESFGGLLEI